MAAGNRNPIIVFLFGAALLGLLGWTLLLQNKYDKMEQMILKENVRRQERSVNGNVFMDKGGATYIRWGRTICPQESELVYSGHAGGQDYDTTGGGAEYLCLTDRPLYSKSTTTLEIAATIKGVEIQLETYSTILFDTSNSVPNALHNSDVQCAVCRSKIRRSVIMIPGTYECEAGWHREYHGYLMAANDKQKSAKTYACVDNAPEAGQEGGQRNDDGGVMYHVQGVCGSLPCPPYVQGNELTCVVCTK